MVLLLMCLYGRGENVELWFSTTYCTYEFRADSHLYTLCEGGGNRRSIGEREKARERNEMKWKGYHNLSQRQVLQPLASRVVIVHSSSSWGEHLVWNFKDEAIFERFGSWNVCWNESHQTFVDTDYIMLLYVSHDTKSVQVSHVYVIFSSLSCEDKVRSSISSM